MGRFFLAKYSTASKCDIQNIMDKYEANFIIEIGKELFFKSYSFIFEWKIMMMPRVYVMPVRGNMGWTGRGINGWGWGDLKNKYFSKAKMKKIESLLTITKLT